MNTFFNCSEIAEFPNTSPTYLCLNGFTALLFCVSLIFLGRPWRAALSWRFVAGQHFQLATFVTAALHPKAMAAGWQKSETEQTFETHQKLIKPEKPCQNKSMVSATTTRSSKVDGCYMLVLSRVPNLQPEPSKNMAQKVCLSWQTAISPTISSTVLWCISKCLISSNIRGIQTSAFVAVDSYRTQIPSLSDL